MNFMVRVAISDESGTHGGNLCYGIGSFVVGFERFLTLENELKEIVAARRIDYELKWNGIRAFRRDIDAICVAIDHVLRSGAVFYAIVVEKASYRKWHEDEENAFYITYQLQATHVARADGAPFEFWIDERSDAYAKYPEVMQIITNYKSARTGDAELLNVTMVDSRSYVLLQLADVLVGAITADTNRLLAGGGELNPGKEELIQRFARMIGWDRLCYDTYPNGHFNVWHFPFEFRAHPATRDVVFRPEHLRSA